MDASKFTEATSLLHLKDTPLECKHKGVLYTQLSPETQRPESTTKSLSVLVRTKNAGDKAEELDVFGTFRMRQKVKSMIEQVCEK